MLLTTNLANMMFKGPKFFWEWRRWHSCMRNFIKFGHVFFELWLLEVADAWGWMKQLTSHCRGSSVLFMHSGCTSEMVVGSYKVWWRLVKWFLRNGGCCLQNVAGVVEEAVDEGLEASMSDVVNGEPLFSYSSWKEDSNDMLKCIFYQLSSWEMVQEEIIFL